MKVLQYYLKCTETPSAGKKALFLPLRKTASITSWLKQTIQLAYEVVGQEAELQNLHSVAHEVRALSASWNDLKIECVNVRDHGISQVAISQHLHVVLSKGSCGFGR